MKTIILRFLNSSGFIILRVIPYSLIQDGTARGFVVSYGHIWFRIHVHARYKSHKNQKSKGRSFQFSGVNKQFSIETST
jgi:hypothetical protein